MFSRIDCPPNPSHSSASPHANTNAIKGPRRISVLTTKEWRAQAREETTAARLGLPTHGGGGGESGDEQNTRSNTPSTIDKVLVEWYLCDTCGIGIGPDHYETDRYLYPITNGGTYLSDESWQTYDYQWLLVCGGCAKWKKRNLPDALRIFTRDHWETTLLIAPEGEAVRPSQMDNPQEMAAIRLAAEDYLLARCQWYLQCTLISSYIPLREVMMTNREEHHHVKTQLNTKLTAIDERLATIREDQLTITPPIPTSAAIARRQQVRESLLSMMTHVDTTKYQQENQKGA